MCSFPEGNYSYLTGNPVDNCWRCCDMNWEVSHQKPVDFTTDSNPRPCEKKQLNLHRTDSLNNDPTNHVPETLCHSLVQEPL